MFFENRQEAGKKLGKLLAQKYKDHEVVIYALPRGGVVTGIEVAKILKSPLDIILTRKIGHPFSPEFALAVLSENGHITADPKEIASVDKKWFEKRKKKEMKEIIRRRKTYIKNVKTVDVKNKIAIIVDDGIATGLTMKAAIGDVKTLGPKKIVVAVPVMPKEIANDLNLMVDDVIALNIPNEFLGAVGSYYKKFPQIGDDEVIRLLSGETEDPILFAFPEFEQTERKLLAHLINFSSGEFVVKRFPNQELHIKLKTKVSDKHCIILGSISPPDNRIFETLFLSHTLEKEKAKSVTGLFPYLAYTRHDKKVQGESLGASFIGNLFQASLVKQIITIDSHSEESKKLFKLPIISLSPAETISNKIKELDLNDITIVAPDEGAIKRAKNVANFLYLNDIAYCAKTRTPNGVFVDKLHGKTTKIAVVIDDILDTGKTLIGCCEKLLENGVEKMYIFVTHGLFTGNDWKKLWNLNVKKIYCTDTLPISNTVLRENQNVHTISIVPLMIDALRKYL